MDRLVHRAICCCLRRHENNRTGDGLSIDYSLNRSPLAHVFHPGKFEEVLNEFISCEGRLYSWHTNILTDIVQRGGISEVSHFLDGLGVNVSPDPQGAAGHNMPTNPVLTSAMSGMLPVAVAMGKLDLAKFLLAKGACVNTLQGCFLPLVLAVGDANCVQLLLDAGADVNLDGPSGELALCEAAKQGDVLCMKLLMKAGADVNLANKRGETPLLDAIDSGALDCVEFLLEAGADVNLVDSSGNNKALMMAVKKNDLHSMRLLIKLGADVNQAEWYGLTPLRKTAGLGDEECLKFFIEAGADVNKIDEWGGSALMDAVQAHQAGCVLGLLGAGADVKQTEMGHKITPLLHAVQNGDLYCMILLIKAGSDVNHTDYNGQTPLKRASAQRHTNSLKLLLEAGVHVVNRSISVCVKPGQKVDNCKSICTLIFAAGQQEVLVETRNQEPSRFFPPDWEDLSLKNQCRKVIREHLLTLDSTNLFKRTPQLTTSNNRPGLPAKLVSYLLYEQNLDMDWDRVSQFDTDCYDGGPH